MDLRSCGTAYFIQTIRGGVVIKVSNSNSHGRPVIRSKILKDVYESEDTKRQQKPPSVRVFGNKKVKHESPCCLVVDRTLQEIKPEPVEFVPHNEEDQGSGPDDDDTTLKQLKERLLTKKRKCVPLGDHSKNDNGNEKAAEDESDLNEPLINWKPKHLKSKPKRKRANLGVISPETIDVAIKSEESVGSEVSLEVGGKLAPVIRVKVEVPDADHLGCQNKASSIDASSIGHDEVLNPGQNINKYENCVTNAISYDHLEDVEPISMLLTRDGMSVNLKTLESNREKSLYIPPVEIEKQKEMQGSDSCRGSLSEDPNSDVSSHSRSSSSVEMPNERSSSGTQVPDMAIDGCMGLHQESNSVIFEDITEAEFANELNDSQSSPDKNCGSNPDSITTSKTEENLICMEDTIADEEQPSTFSFDAITRNDLNCEGHFENDLLTAADKQNLAFPITSAENESSLENGTCDNAGTISTPEPHQPPERLLSTRKALSPSSQEQLRLAMTSVEIWNDSDQNIVPECKGKFFENQTGKKASLLRSDMQYDKITVNHKRPGQVSQRKVIISPKHNIKKSQIAKGNLEGPRFSRSLPNFSTGCTSVQGCSESAIAFSQRQMHDMESLAVKLMNELKSMKDIVEQKLLFEAYRSASLKNDADEIKTAINNAARAEDTAKKWMSMMARDCNRFCKIMKMTPDSTSTSSDTSPKERRKIMFADEAGGELCHIKIFDNGVTSSVSDAVKQ